MVDNIVVASIVVDNRHVNGAADTRGINVGVGSSLLIQSGYNETFQCLLPQNFPLYANKDIVKNFRHCITQNFLAYAKRCITSIRNIRYCVGRNVVFRKKYIKMEKWNYFQSGSVPYRLCHLTKKSRCNSNSRPLYSEKNFYSLHTFLIFSKFLGLFLQKHHPR